METYEDIDFTYGEQPTEAKWDQLGLNDKRFNEILTYGWQDPGETWTYASATTFTISGDKTTKYQKGDRIKLTQTTVKYFVVVNVVYSSPNTTITVTGGTDYTLANAAITANYYSKDASPVGFPGIFATAAGKIQIEGTSKTEWGFVDVVFASGAYTESAQVTFAIAFAALHNIQITTNIGAGGQGTSAHGVRYESTTGFKAWGVTAGADTIRFWWTAKGTI